MILGRSSCVKKHGVLFDIINDSILFSLRYYSLSGALFVLVPIMLTVETEIISMTIQQNISLNRIPKKGLGESLEDILGTPEKIFDKKKRIINTSKRQLAIQNRESETVVISSPDNSGKKHLLMLL